MNMAIPHVVVSAAVLIITWVIVQMLRNILLREVVVHQFTDELVVEGALHVVAEDNHTSDMRSANSDILWKLYQKTR